MYIPKAEIELARQLAQKSYDEKVLRYSERAEKQIEKLLKCYEDNKIEEIYLSEHSKRQNLIKPIEPTYEQKLESWLSIPYQGKGFTEGTPVILTNTGLRVRSKSEKILADYFDSQGIKYKYECPLRLGNYGIVYPDFTFLSPRTGRKMFWEHEGMMDNPDYAKTAVQKIESYEKSGIFPGEDLILTFETTMTVISTELIRSLVNKYLV